MIWVVDYGGGNLFSVMNALESLGQEAQILQRPEDYRSGKLIIPGVGAFGDAMHRLQESGFTEFLREQAAAGTPVLGICLGLQILFEGSEEAPGVAGLGLLPGKVRRFHRAEKVPHMGWNQIEPAPEKRLLAGIRPGEYVYFAHSYHVPAQGRGFEAAICEYGERFAAVVEQDNLFGVQFHPEKSHTVGMQILQNFLKS